MILAILGTNSFAQQKSSSVTGKTVVRATLETIKTVIEHSDPMIMLTKELYKLHEQNQTKTLHKTEKIIPVKLGQEFVAKNTTNAFILELDENLSIKLAPKEISWQERHTAAFTAVSVGPSAGVGCYIPYLSFKVRTSESKVILELRKVEMSAPVNMQIFINQKDDTLVLKYVNGKEIKTHVITQIKYLGSLTKMPPVNK